MTQIGKRIRTIEVPVPENVPEGVPQHWTDEPVEAPATPDAPVKEPEFVPA